MIDKTANNSNASGQPANSEVEIATDLKGPDDSKVSTLSAENPSEPLVKADQESNNVPEPSGNQVPGQDIIPEVKDSSDSLTGNSDEENSADGKDVADHNASTETSPKPDEYMPVLEQKHNELVNQVMQVHEESMQYIQNSINATLNIKDSENNLVSDKTDTSNKNINSMSSISDSITPAGADDGNSQSADMENPMEQVEKAMREAEQQTMEGMNQVSGDATSTQEDNSPVLSVDEAMEAAMKCIQDAEKAMANLGDSGSAE